MSKTGTACPFMARLSTMGEMTLGDCVRNRCKAGWSDKYQRCVVELALEVLEGVKEGTLTIGGQVVALQIASVREPPRSTPPEMLEKILGQMQRGVSEEDLKQG